MNKTRLIAALLALAAFTAPGLCQRSFQIEPPLYNKRSLFIYAGYNSGPHFTKFVEWANAFYAANFMTDDKIDDFGGGLSFCAGIRHRFARYLAVEFSFGLHSVSTKKKFTNNNPSIPFPYQIQELDMNVAQFSASAPVILQLINDQRVIPYISAGVTAFSIRLDHAIDYTVRHTKVALAANFSAGMQVKIDNRLAANLRGLWTAGKATMPVSSIVGQPDEFELNLSTAQFQAGIIYDID